jgi:hypothetical protein
MIFIFYVFVVEKMRKGNANFCHFVEERNRKEGEYQSCCVVFGELKNELNDGRS